MTVDTASLIDDLMNLTSSRGTVTDHPAALDDEPAIVTLDRLLLAGDSSSVTADCPLMAGDP